MRNILSVLVAGLLLTSAAARAQQILPPTGGDGTVDIGIRFSDLTGDDYRLQRFRDLSDGMLVDRFRMDQRGQRWWFSAGADHLGRDDQRLFGDFRVDRKLKISFVWDEVPLNYSGDTRTLYMVQSPGTLRLVDSLQGGIEGGRFTLADVVGQAVPFAVSSYRHVAAVDLVYNATRELRLKARVMRTDRKGTMPYIGSFGFSDAVELAAPIDTRTTDVEAGLEWNNPYAALRVGYNGSTFDNHVPTLVWDNPLKLTDSTASNNYSNGLGTSQGRAALPPSNTMHGITTAGSFRLPGNTRISATVTAGAWNQNEVLLPITINTAVPAAPLPRETAEAEARTLAMTYGLTSRPNQYLWFNARYRYYDYNNRTPEFTTPFDVVWKMCQPPLSIGSFFARRPSSVLQSIACASTFTPALRRFCTVTSAAAACTGGSLGVSTTIFSPL